MKKEKITINGEMYGNLPLKSKLKLLFGMKVKDVNLIITWSSPKVLQDMREKRK